LIKPTVKQLLGTDADDDKDITFSDNWKVKNVKWDWFGDYVKPTPTNASSSMPQSISVDPVLIIIDDCLGTKEMRSGH